MLLLGYRFSHTCKNIDIYAGSLGNEVNEVVSVYLILQEKLTQMCKLDIFLRFTANILKLDILAL